MCLVDAEQVFSAPEHMELKLRQMAFADMIVLNKVDLVEQEQVQKIHDWLGSRFTRYRLVEAINADVPLEILLSVGRFDADVLPATKLEKNCGHETDCGCSQDAGSIPHIHEFTHNHSAAAFSTTSLETDEPVSLEALKSTVKKLPGSIYRMKGMVYSTEAPDRCVILQVVGKRADIAMGAPWGDRSPCTRVVAIGAPGAVDKETLESIFTYSDAE